MKLSSAADACVPPDPSSARIDAQLRLALLGDRRTPKALAALERAARRAGLTGAEIDAALAGRSFDIRTSAVIAVARALRAGCPAEVEQARRRALSLGLCAAELLSVGDATTRILADGR